MKKETSLDVLDKQVRKSNALIQQARFSLTVQQQKIILYLISQIQPWDEDFKVYNLSALEFAKVCGLEFKGGKDYAELKEQIKKIADKSMWLLLEDGDTESLIRWIESPRIRRKSGTIQLRLNEDLKPYLLQLKERYTEYQLIYTLHFKSKYSIRLYELICSIHFHELEEYKRTFKLERLKQYLDCESYKDYRDFRKRVLDNAVNEINRYSDKNITYEPITIGRKVVEIELTITTKDAIERLRITSEIEKELGLNQLSLFDTLSDKCYI